MFKTIIFATDGLVAADRVLFYVEHLARKEEMQVIVVHAYELPHVYEWAEGYADLAALRALSGVGRALNPGNRASAS